MPNSINKLIRFFYYNSSNLLSPYRAFLKRSTLLSRDGGSSYKTYVFKESTRRCAIDRKGRGRKEVIYLRVANVSYTRGVRESTGLLL